MWILLGIVVACGVMSLVPFLYPDTIMNTPGAFLNHVVGGLLASAGIESGLVAGAGDVYALSLLGVLVVYGVPALLILYILRTH